MPKSTQSDSRTCAGIVVLGDFMVESKLVCRKCLNGTIYHSKLTVACVDKCINWHGTMFINEL